MQCLGYKNLKAKRFAITPLLNAMKHLEKQTIKREL